MITRKELVGMLVDGGWTKADGYDADKLKSKIKEAQTEYQEDQFSAKHAETFKRLKSGEAFQTSDEDAPTAETSKKTDKVEKPANEKKELAKTIVRETKPKGSTPIAAAKVEKEKTKPAAKVELKKKEAPKKIATVAKKPLAPKKSETKAKVSTVKTFPVARPVKLAKPETTKPGPSPADKKTVKVEQTELFKADALKSSPKPAEKTAPKGLVDKFGNRLGSIASRVNEVLTTEWQTDQQIADKAGVTLKEVRGRLYYATNSDKIVECERLTRYRLPAKKS